MSKIRIKQINETELLSFLESGVSGDMSSVQSGIDSLTSVTDTLSGDIANLTSQFLTISGQNTGISARLNSLESSFDSLDVDLSTLSGDILVLQSATGSISSNINALEESFSGVSGDISGLNDFKTGFVYNYIHLIDAKNSGVGGGTFSGGSWTTRDLTDKVADSGNLATLDSNILTLSAGLYSCDISCPAIGVESHMTRLYNLSDSSVLLSGTIEYAGNFSSRSFIKGRFVIPGTTGKLVAIQHLCASTVTGSGMGSGAGLNDSSLKNIYTIAEFSRIGV